MGGRHGRPLEKKTGGRDWGGGPAAALVEEQAEASRRAGRRRTQSTTAAGPPWPPPRTRRHPQRSPAPKSAAPTAPRSPQFADILIPHGDAEPLRFNPVASRRGRRAGATRGSTGRHPRRRPRRRPRRSPAAAAPSASHGDGPGESHATGTPGLPRHRLPSLWQRRRLWGNEERRARAGFGKERCARAVPSQAAHRRPPTAARLEHTCRWQPGQPGQEGVRQRHLGDGLRD